MNALRRSLIALGIGAALVAPAAAVAGQKLSLPIVLHPECMGTCPMDTIKKGLYQVQPTDDAGANGLEFKLSLAGVEYAGVPVDLSNITIVVAFSLNGAACQSFQAPSGTIEAGRMKLIFTGADTSPPI